MIGNRIHPTTPIKRISRKQHQLQSPLNKHMASTLASSSLALKVDYADISPGDNKQKNPLSFNVLNGRKGLCHVDAISEYGKRCQLVKMIFLVMTPVLVLLGLTCFFMTESVTQRDQLAQQTQVLYHGTQLGELIHALQKERDQTALYLSAIGPNTKIYLLDRYAETNMALVSLSTWPVNLARDKIIHFQNRDSFARFISAHRNALDLRNPTVYEEINFYNNQVEVLITWLYDAMKLSRFSDIWKSLVTYKKVVSSKEAAGIERALGSSYFANGGFHSNYYYLWYLRKVNTFMYEYRTAELFSEDIRQISKGILTSGQNNLFSFVWSYRAQLSKDEDTEISVKQAKYYYDNMTLLIDQLFKIQRKVGIDIETILDERQSETIKNIIVAVVLMAVIIALFPIQMLPPEVARQLMDNKNVCGEFFTEVTICFSEIDDFLRITKEYNPIQVIALLQEVYSVFDQRIAQYDVHKVENIADQNMVVSGVPRRNGRLHGKIIADMALDIVDSFENRESCTIMEKIAIKIGLHSGAVMAGVVGLKLPKFSLFGDTVNTAARMETSSEGNKIHISAATHDLLMHLPGYKFKCRGPRKIKGKGSMITYWLFKRKASSMSFSNVIKQVQETYPAIEIESPTNNVNIDARPKTEKVVQFVNDDKQMEVEEIS